MNVIILLMAMIGLCVAAPQYYIPSEFVYQHPANVLNSAIEDTLPNELRNNFYKNPRIAARLAKESWFFNKEMQVIDRETDKIPREKVYNVLHNAGFVRK
ncbi:uncharacterized protein LOC117232762 [Bombus vosnesenskii]|uniref:Uncharacterized protein LOC117232762 n=2 Tax=Pyrobombus TaxID=144703 RepID=A0A6J3K6G6_9HYME|nr:uncharacterized protein LOC117160271 [Bombus vancouverensis nearcticus]XP_033196827.1 uncharacterized protein LOC117160271 [Bombus vancouverensis nearcticus]XP_033196836.1 uncharacterized protein LOC117160271 [Bombus vancouverensis nearcticus]XP_033196843.1 uncharacterized protein LOC117160271 [Bombus vancouverensis nearcticus]XP_033318505.1 uncharacterized protein LOC117216093 [Bombus bifarius]XP_033318512.1 uncharacterized protein LOC117216093 [Bombus bifarius]XP_033318520.1 uncharacteri